MQKENDFQDEAVEFAPDDGDFDVLEPDPGKFRDAYVNASDWTTGTIIDQIRRGNISLNPKFQRRDAWTQFRKSRFIESIITGVPIPQLVLAESKEQKGKFLVLDGKQRLLTITQFVGLAESKYNRFKLTGMEFLKELEGKNFEDLKGDLYFSEVADAFENNTLRSCVIRNWPNQDFLHTVFLRLNTGSVGLSPQELRQALFPGSFSDFLDQRAGTSAPLLYVLKLTEPDFRMRDVELFLRTLAFTTRLGTYRGNLKHFLDETTSFFNAAWDLHENDIKETCDKIDFAISTSLNVFGVDEIARRPRDGKSKRPFNKAIFDVQVYYFTDYNLEDSILKNSTQINEQFIILWSSDENFRKSVESTTKSMESTVYRLQAWGNVLQKVLGVKLPIPERDAQGTIVVP